MSGVLLKARKPCLVAVGDRMRLTGASATGEALTTPNWIAHPAGAFFRARAGAAEILVRQGLAEETAAPDYLRALLAAVLPAKSPAEAALAAFAAGIMLLAPGEGLSRFRIIRTREDAERTFAPGFLAEPVFRLEHTVAAGRLLRHFAWRSGAVCEVAVQ